MVQGGCGGGSLLLGVQGEVSGGGTLAPGPPGLAPRLAAPPGGRATVPGAVGGMLRVGRLETE